MARKTTVLLLLQPFLTVCSWPVDFHQRLLYSVLKHRLFLWLLKLSSSHTNFYVFSDSMSCLQAISYRKFGNPDILRIIEKCNTLQEEGKLVNFCWVPSHVGIKGNEKADCAAKAALQLPISADIQIPYTDLKVAINTYFTRVWQTHWSQVQFNKLQTIKPSIGETTLKNVTVRRDEVVLHRARIGYTFLRILT